MAEHGLSSGRRPCRPLWAKEHPNSSENFTCVAEDFLNGEQIKVNIWPAGAPAATIESRDGLILTPMGGWGDLDSDKTFTHTYYIENRCCDG